MAFGIEACDDQVVLAHLNGEHTIGTYPLLPDDTCWFVAADFDEASWRDDVLDPQYMFGTGDSPRTCYKCR